MTSNARPMVVVLGAINRDILMHSDFLPRPGHTVQGDFAVRTGGGKGANQAAAAAALGADVRLIGVVGADADGESLVAELVDQGVDTAAIATTDRPTGIASVIVDRNGENQICVVAGANDDLDPQHVVESMNRAAPGPAIVLASLEIPLDAVLAAAQEARRLGWPFILNPAPASVLPDELLELVTVLVPNEHEVLNLGAPGPSGLLLLGMDAVVVTAGARGSTIYRADHRPETVDAFKALVVDTTGAGDCYCGALACALGAGNDMATAARFANAAAALAISTVGARASLPDQGLVQRLLTTCGHESGGI